MMRRVYISGGMSGFTEEEIKERFGNAEADLKFYTRYYYKPIKVYNPAKWRWFLRYLPYKVALVFDLLMLCRCDTIYMLKNWTASNGATIEYKFANCVGIQIEYER